MCNNNILLNKPKKFFDMSKIIRINPVLKRNGDKKLYSHYQILTKLG